MKKIIFGISGIISLHEACDLVSMFVSGGFEVRIIMTKNATRYIDPLTFQTLSGCPVATDKTSWKNRSKNRSKNQSIEHLSLRDDASLLLVAPASGKIIVNFVEGIANDLLSTTYLSVNCPVVIAPAVIPIMYHHPIMQQHLQILKERGVIIVEPPSEAFSGENSDYFFAPISRIYEVAINAIN
jgi:phosphopantothenoylcysteine synthetase/decarboxylase